MKCLFIFILSLIGISLEGIEEERLVRRVQAHLLIKDSVSAQQEVEEGLQLYPYSLDLQAAYLQVLADRGEEKKMLKVWEAHIKAFPEQIHNRLLIETMAWGILDKASLSSSLITRCIALLAGFFSQDAKGVTLIYQGLHDSNAMIRVIAVELAGKLRDDRLKEEIKRLFKEETVWSVRNKVIKAIGKMKILELRRPLEACIASDKSSVEEKTLSIEALVKLLDSLERPEVKYLASSSRVGLRLLACEAIGHFTLYRDGDLLFDLAHDLSPEVRAKALQTIGLLRPQHTSSYPVQDLALYYLRDLDPKVSISAGWLLTLYDATQGASHLETFLSHPKQEVRLWAASALALTGRYGVSCMIPHLMNHADPYVRLNLALGLMGQQTALDQVEKVLLEELSKEKMKWCYLEEGIFNLLAPQTLQKAEDLVETPEVDNQMTRLEMINKLALLNPAHAQEVLKQFLLERRWGISGLAAALLLTEGDEVAVQVVKNLLSDPNSQVRLQAALILSLWGQEEEAIQVLEEGYQKVDKEIKARILESLGRIGAKRSIPFLIEKLKEPSQYLRIISAMALIQCLNH